MTDNALANPAVFDGQTFKVIMNQLSPQEVMLVVGLVHCANVNEALFELDIAPAEWTKKSQERRDMILQASKLAALDVAQAAFEVLQQATMTAVTTMSALMYSEDEETRYKASRFIIEHAQGKAGVRKEQATKIIKHKHYLVSKASPDSFDDEDPPDDDDDEPIEGLLEPHVNS